MLSTVEIKGLDAQGGPERGLLYTVELTFSVQRAFLFAVDGVMYDAANRMLCARSSLIQLLPGERHSADREHIVGSQVGKGRARLLFPLRDEALRAIETRADREHVNLTLQVRAQTFDLPPAQASGQSLNVVGMPGLSQDVAVRSFVPQSIWIGLLSKMGWSELALFEIPMLPFRDDPNLKTALDRLRDAEARLRGGDYRGVIAKCRDAFESAAKYEAAGNVAKGFDLLFERAFKADGVKPALVSSIVKALRDHANELGRHEQYPALPAARSEAEFVYASTVAMFSMLSRRLTGEES
jgi:hypothetical protein